MIYRPLHINFLLKTTTSHTSKLLKLYRIECLALMICLSCTSAPNSDPLAKSTFQGMSSYNGCKRKIKKPFRRINRSIKTTTFHTSKLLDRIECFDDLSSLPKQYVRLLLIRSLKIHFEECQVTMAVKEKEKMFPPNEYVNQNVMYLQQTDHMKAKYSAATPDEYCLPVDRKQKL